MSSPLNPPTVETPFTPADTQVAKGVALCLLLFFHLFYQHPEIGPKLFGISVVYRAAQTANICVPMFVVLSGYGLMESARRRRPSALEFYRRRLARIYIDYWCIWAVFVPAGILLFSRGLTEAYEEHVWGRFVINVLGLQEFFGFGGFNVTWWFISLIVALYLLFPLLKRLSDCSPLGCLALCALGPIVNLLGTGTRPDSSGLLLPPAVRLVLPWLLPFGVGIYLSQVAGLARAKSFLRNRRMVKLALSAAILAVLVALRLFSPILGGHGLLGWAFALMIILIGDEAFARPRWLRWTMERLGQHSYNIFMLHTFIYYYYFPGLAYSFKNPALIFLFLLTVSLLLSVLIERSKAMLGVTALQSRLGGGA